MADEIEFTVADTAPVLRRGEHGDWVRYLQQLLETANHPPGPINSSFGEQTEQAVKAFQAWVPIPVTGVVDKTTWQYLIKKSETLEGLDTVRGELAGTADAHDHKLAVGEEVGRALADIHREKGVELALEDSVAAFEGSGRIERVLTTKGRLLVCDLVVAGIGILPNSELLAAAGAAVDNGVLVDERCRTSLPDVWAAGDVANHLHPLFGRLRVEHWNNGYQQGRAAARSLLGGEQPYDYLHSFWSDQYEHVIEYVGFAAGWDRLVFRGRPESRKFLGFYLKDGIVRAAVGAE